MVVFIAFTCMKFCELLLFRWYWINHFCWQRVLSACFVEGGNIIAFGPGKICSCLMWASSQLGASWSEPLSVKVTCFFTVSTSGVNKWQPRFYKNDLNMNNVMCVAVELFHLTLKLSVAAHLVCRFQWHFYLEFQRLSKETCTVLCSYGSHCLIPCIFVCNIKLALFWLQPAIAPWHTQLIFFCVQKEPMHSTVIGKAEGE